MLMRSYFVRVILEMESATGFNEVFSVVFFRVDCTKGSETDYYH